MGSTKRSVLALLCLGLALSATAMPTRADVIGEQRQDVVRVTASDGNVVASVLTTPKGGMNVNTPALVHIHGGPGASPLAGSGPWIAEGLAARGYTTMAPLVRHGSDLYGFNFDEQNKDVKAVVDYLAGVGFKEIIMSGSSFGSISSTRYVIDTKDPRIKAVIHFAPTADMNAYAKRALGAEAYDRAVADAGKLVSEGRGDTVISRSFTHEAATWLYLWGPASVGVNSVLFKQIHQPMLLLFGDKDPFGDEARLQELKAAATSSSKTDYLFYKGGVSHSFYPKETHPRVIEDVSQWLASVGLGPQPRALSQVLTINEGDNFAGAAPMDRAMKYSPEAGLKTGAPAVVFVNDSSNDALRGPNDRVAESLAGAGHLALGVQLARGPEFASYTYERGRAALARWIDYAVAQGPTKVVLVGQGLGAARIADYLAVTGDSRVSSLVFLGPKSDNAAWLKAALGQKQYDELVAEARSAPPRVAGAPGAGRPQISTFVQRDITLPAPAGPGVTQQLVMTPDAFLGMYGPDAPVLSSQLGKLKAPTLILSGSKSAYLTRAAFDSLAKANKARALWYEGADDDFAAYEAQVAKDIANWISAN